MTRLFRHLGICLLLISVCVLMPPGSPAQDKTLEEIAGEYNLDLGNRMLPFIITIKDAKPFFDALVPGLDPQPMTPVQGKELTFSSVDPNGNDVVFAFIADGQKKITGCMVSVPAQGMEVKAEKVKK